MNRILSHSTLRPDPPGYSDLRDDEAWRCRLREGVFCDHVVDVPATVAVHHDEPGVLGSRSLHAVFGNQMFHAGHGAFRAGWLSHAPPVSFEAVVHIQRRRVTGGTPDNLGGDACDGHVRRNVLQHDASGTHFGTFTYLNVADHFASGGE
jgi:hypothetical protein